jgi:hypothetical protein
VNQKELLHEANKLVSDGLRKSAIALLLEYVDTNPDDSKVLRTLGRAYLLDSQPEFAVRYLRRSLEVSQQRERQEKPRSYRGEGFGDDDLAFVESESEKSEEEVFDIEEEEISASSKPISHTKESSDGSESHQEKPETVVEGIHGTESSSAETAINNPPQRPFRPSSPNCCRSFIGVIWREWLVGRRCVRIA